MEKIEFTLLPNCRAKSGNATTLLEYISKVRSCQNTTDKAKASAIIVSGVWEDRHTLKELNGIIHADIDDVQDIEGVISKLKGDKYVLMVHKSISGKGLKVFAQVAKDKINESNYTDIVKAWIRYLEKTYNIKCDEKCTDIKRLSFLANDSNLFYNDVCEEFEFEKWLPKMQVKHNGQGVVSSGLYDGATFKYDGVLSTIKKEVEENFNTQFVVGSRNSHINKFVWKCNRAGIPVEVTIEWIKNNYNLSRDFSIKEVQAIANSVYRRCQLEFGCDGVFYGDLKDFQGTKKKLRRQLANELLKDFAILYLVAGSGENKGVIRKYCRVENGVIYTEKYHDIKIIKDTVAERYKMLDKSIRIKVDVEDVLDEITESHLSNLRKIYYVYTNKAIYLKNCKLLNGEFIQIGDELVLASKVLDIEYRDVDGKSKFEVFVERAFGEERKELVELVIGYLLARERQGRGNDRVIMIMDDNVLDDYSAGNNGGTGKTLFARLIGDVIGRTNVDGKKIDNNDKFILSNYNFGDGLILIDDVTRHFDFESLFVLVTTDLQVEKKFENVVSIPPELGVKFVITSNFRVVVKGENNKRRRIDLFTTNYYNSEYSVRDDLGEMAIDAWDNDERCRFIKYLAKCWRYYREKGMKYLEAVNNLVNKDSMIILQRIEGISDYVDEYIDSLKGLLEVGKCTDDLYNAYVIYCQRENIKHARNKAWFIRLFIKDLKRYNLEAEVRIKKEGGRTMKYLYLIKGGWSEDSGGFDVNLNNDDELDF